jgi:hypothetical protein
VSLRCSLDGPGAAGGARASRGVDRPRRPGRTARASRRLLAGGAALLLAAVLAVLAARLAVALGPATDLYGRWYGMRQLLLAGQDPYGPAVTRALAAQTPFLAPAAPSTGDPAEAPDTLATAFGFLYPLPGVLWLAPLALLPYPAALTVWLVIMLVGLPASAWLLVDATTDVRSGGLARLLCIPLALLSIPTLACLLHAQLAPAVVFAIALAAWLSWRPSGGRRRTDWLAGASLAAGAALKPQLVVLLVPLWLAFHARRWSDPRSRRFLGGAAAGGLFLIAVATLLVPTWPAGFLGAARAYASLSSAGYPEETLAVLPGGPAVVRLTQGILPGPPGAAVAVAGAVGLLAWAARAWLRAARAGDGSGLPAGALGRTLVVTALVVPPAWETNAVVLLLPLAITLSRLGGRPRTLLAFAGVALAVTVADLPLYAIRPWRNGPILALAYALLLVGTTMLASRAAGGGLSSRSARAPGAAARPVPARRAPPPPGRPEAC